MRLLRSLLAGLATTLALATSWAQTARAPIEFNYGIPTADHVSVFVAQDLGLFEKAGLKPKFYNFASGAPLLAGLKSGSLDVVTTGMAVIFAIGQGVPLKLIFWETNASAAEALVVDPKSGIKSYKDIAKAGKIAAATGTCAQVSLLMMAQKAGVDPAKLNVVNIPAPLMRNAFASGSIDAGVAWPPYSLQLQAEGLQIAAFDEDFAPAGGVCPGLTAVRPEFLQRNPEIGVRLVEVEALAREAMARDPQVAVDAFVKHLGLTPEVAKATLARECCGRIPGFATQLDPASPYSLTAREGGLLAKLALGSQVYAAAKVIPEPVPLKALQDAIDPSHLQAWVKANPGRKF